MGIRFERYRMTDGKTELGAAYFNPLFADIDLRVASLEALKVSWSEALNEVTRFGLERINVVIAPALEESRTLLDALLSDAAGLRAGIMDEVNAYVEPLLEPYATPLAVDLTYDSHGRVIGISERYPSDMKIIEMTYNDAGMIETIFTSFNGTIRTETYAYNAAGQLTTVSSYEGYA